MLQGGFRRKDDSVCMKVGQERWRKGDQSGFGCQLSVSRMPVVSGAMKDMRSSHRREEPSWDWLSGRFRITMDHYGGRSWRQA